MTKIKKELDELILLRKDEDLSWRESSSYDREILKNTMDKYELEVKKLQNENKFLVEEKEFIVKSFYEEGISLKKKLQAHDLLIVKELMEIQTRVETLASHPYDMDSLTPQMSGLEIMDGFIPKDSPLNCVSNCDDRMEIEVPRLPKEYSRKNSESSPKTFWKTQTKKVNGNLPVSPRLTIPWKGKIIRASLAQLHEFKGDLNHMLAVLGGDDPNEVEKSFRKIRILFR